MLSKIGPWVLSASILLFLIIFIPHNTADKTNNYQESKNIAESLPQSNTDIETSGNYDDYSIDESNNDIHYSDRIDYYCSDSMKTDAWVFAQDAIKSILKAPRTAKFEFFNEDNILYLGGNRFMVTIEVDADNAYGAKLRNIFVVDLTITGEYSYTINDIVQI